MEAYNLIQDIFIEEKEEEIQQNEQPYIDILVNILKKCQVLKRNEEAQAIPYLDIICAFIERLLEKENFILYITRFPKIKDHLMEVLFPGLAKIILGTQIFPNFKVLERTNRFYELMVLLSLQACKNGYQEHWLTIQTFFNADQKFFKENKNFCSLEINPYGDKNFGRPKGFDVWLEQLKEGDEIDAIKIDKRKTKAIWSRAKILNRLQGGTIQVQFLNEPDRMVNTATHLQTPFVINQLGARSKDWDWRENLKAGDKVDAFIYSTVCAKNGWLACEVTKVIEQEDEEGSYKIAELEEMHSGAPYRGSMNVHDPNLRSYKKFSDIGDLFYNFPNDDAFDIDREKFFAITRAEGDNKSHFKSPYVHSKFYIKMINSFGRNGGFKLMEDLLFNSETWCAPHLTGAFMYVLAQCGPYLLDGFMRDYGVRMVDKAVENLIEAPKETVRDFNKEIIGNVHAALTIAYKRSKDYHESANKAEHFVLNIAFLCIKSDFLERKLHGITILSDLNSRVNLNELTTITKQSLVDRIREEDILPGIMKGHPQLITKSLNIFKAMFTLDTITIAELELLWNGIRNGDIDTKNSIIGILNEIYFDLSKEHTEYFVNKMIEIETNELHIEEIELAYNLANYSTTHHVEEGEEKSDISNKVVLLLWHVATDTRIMDLDIIKKATDNLMLVIRYSEDINVGQKIFDEAIENITANKSVLQSLKVIKKMLNLNNEKQTLIEYLIQKNIIENIFANLKTFKEEIRAKIADLELDLDDMTPETIKKYMPNQRYSFEENVLERMGFVDFIALGSEFEDEKILEIITSIWDELVVNSLIPVESVYFRKWFINFSSEVTEQLNHGLLSKFFYEKIKFLNDSSKIKSKGDLLKTFTEIFIRINLLENKVEEKVIKMVDEFSGSYQAKITEENHYLVLTSPDELEGIGALWDIIMNTDDDELAHDLIEFVTPLYTTPEIDIKNKINYRTYMANFIDRCQTALQETTSVEGWDQDEAKMRKVQRVIILLQTIVDYSQSRGISDLTPLSSFFRGDLVEMSIISKISSYTAYETKKKIKLKVYGNTTIHELRTLIASKIKKVSWREVKIVRSKRKYQITEKDNGRTLTDIGYTLGEIITVVSNPVPKVKEEKLIVDGEINPKAMKVFNLMFEDFSHGKEYLDTKECAKFISTVLEDNFDENSERTKKFIAANDMDKVGKVQRKDFIKFYVDSCHSKPGPVRMNIKACNYKEDFTRKESGMELSLEAEDLAAWHLNKNLEVMDSLFRLIDRSDECGALTWDLLGRLPPASSVLKKILNFEGLSEDIESWNTLIENTSPFKTKYYLYILDFLMSEGGESSVDLSVYVHDEADQEAEEFDQSEFKKNWRSDFIKRGGFQHLIKILMSYSGETVDKSVKMSLFSFILKIFKTFILAAVTINKAHLYKNIAYIKLPSSAFKFLKEEEKLEQGGIAGEDQEVTPVEQVVDNEEDEAPKTPTKNMMAAIQATDAGSMAQNYSISTGTGAMQDGEVYTAKMVGPQPAEYYEGTQDTTKEKKASLKEKREKRQKEALRPKEDFVQFRNSLQEALGDDPIKNINRIDLLKLLIELSQSILTEYKNYGMEAISLVELSLSISLSLVLADQEILNKVILTNEVKLLPEDSEMKIEGCSDFVSYIMLGLLSNKLIFIRYFNHGFTVLMREANNPDIQKLLLKIMLNKILDGGNSGREVAKYIDIACPLLEEICSEEKDHKVLLSKTDINDIINLETLFFKILDLLINTNYNEEVDESHKNELIAGYFMILHRILEIEPSIQEKVAQKDEGIVKRIFTQCLFNINHSESTSPQESGIMCTNYLTRGAAYSLLVALCSKSMKNRYELLENGLIELCEKLPVIGGWTYRPIQDKRSMLDFVGIYNLQCICYMNAMLQQFYMTPAFRYGILAADDYQEANIVEVKGRKVDDNVFHQLQRMFGHLDASDRKDYNPKDFCYSFKDFSGNPVNVSLQQDTQEFLNMIFDKLENALKPTPFKGLMESVYGGTTCNIMVCSNCGYTRTKEELFYNLSLEVKNHKSIKDGFEKLTKTDLISDYKCNNCQKKCDITKTSYINQMPNVFIVHLQRLIFDLEVLMNVKINTRYSFPLELNVKPYTLHKYQEDQAKENEGRTEEEMEAEKSKMEEYLQDNDNRKEIEEEQKNFIKALHHSDDYYDYDLSGIVVHRGSAEFGHYYSFINVNRGDPGRPNYTKDKWVEFNDSMIRNFKISNLEEETFGSGTTIERDDEFDYMSMGRFDKIASNKNAYILVYEKRKKKPLKFTFNNINLKEKDHILNNLIKPEFREKAVFSSNEDKSEHTLEVDYYSIEKHIPDNLMADINSDNFQFMIEQHVYSKEFLNFVTGISSISDLPDFKPSMLPNRIYEERDQVPQETKQVLEKIVKMQFNLFRDILSRTSDNECIDKFTLNMMKILSICPEISYEVILEHFFINIHKIYGLVVNCTDSKVRFNTVCLITHAIIVCVNHFEVDLNVDYDPQEDQSTAEFHQDKAKVILAFLHKMMDVIENKKKTTYYKKLGPFFKLWYKLAKANEQFTYMFIKDFELINKFVAFYMKKKVSNFEKNIYQHEKTMDGLLKTVYHLSKYLKEQSTSGASTLVISKKDSTAIYQIGFFQKMMKENYIFNSFAALRGMVKVNCTDNMHYSSLLISECLKNLSMYSDSIVSYLEVLKELCLIQDEYTERRHETIFGVPVLMHETDFHKRNKYGLQCEGNINKTMHDFFISIGANKHTLNGFLKSIIEMRDKSESSCIIMLAFLLEICNNNERLFEYVIKLPSPFAIYSNFYDWIFVIVNQFVEGSNRVSTYSYSYPLAQHYGSKLKENIIQFEENIRAYIMKNHPEATEDTHILITVPSKYIYASKEEKKLLTLNLGGVTPIFSLRNYPIISACVAEENHVDYSIYDSGERQFILRVAEMKHNVAKSVANGSLNISIPKAALYNQMIFTREIPNESKFGQFYDTAYKYSKLKTAPYNLVNQANTGQEEATSHTIDYNKFKLNNNNKRAHLEIVIQEEGKPVQAEREDYESDDSVDENKSNEDNKEEETKEEEKEEEKSESGEDKSDGEGEGDAEEEQEEDEELKKFDMEYTTQNIGLKLALTNVTGSTISCAFKLVPKENCNVFLPTTKICFNIKSNKIDQTFIRLLKIDPEKPYGDFDIYLLFREINEEDFYRPIYINFGTNSDPMIFKVRRSDDKQGEEEPEDADETAEDTAAGDNDDAQDTQSDDNEAEADERIGNDNVPN